MLSKLKLPPNDASVRMISFEEAFKMSRLPTEADTAALQTKSGRSGFSLGDTHYVVEMYLNEELHREICESGSKPTELSRRPQREDAMLVIDTGNGLLFACVPRWVNGKRQPGVYYRLPQEIAKRVYNFTKAGLARALANNNVEEHNGSMRFCYPSTLLGCARAAAMSAGPSSASTLASSSSAAKAGLASASSAISTAEYGQYAIDAFSSMCNNVIKARQSIVEDLDAENDDDVTGLAIGHVSAERRGFSVVPPSPQSSDLYGPTDTSLFIDAVNCAVAGATPAFASGTKRRPVAPAKLSVQKNPPLPDLPLPPVSPMSSKPAAASKKRTSDALNDTVSDAKALVRAKLPALFNGMFDRELRDACIGSNSSGKGPVFIVSGAKLAPKLADPETVKRMASYISTISEKGSAGMQAAERSYSSKTTLESALFSEVDGANIPPEKAAAVIKACPLIGLQFVAGVISGGLGDQIEQQVDALVADVVVPLTERATKAEGDANRIAVECEALRAECDSLRKAVAQKAADEEAARKEEARKQAEEEARKKAEDEARVRAEEEARKKAEEEAEPVYITEDW